MVTKLAFIPAKDVLRKFLRSEALSLRHIDDIWRLESREGECFLAFVDYQNVAFKFECFGIFFTEDNNRRGWVGGESDSTTMHSTALLFCTEWEESLVSEALPGHGRNVCRTAGALEQINDDASSSCVSLVGIVWTSDQGLATKCALIIDVDGDNPTALRYSEDQGLIDALITRCNVVDAASFDAWDQRVSAWVSDEQ